MDKLGVPWERRKEIGYLRSIDLTLKSVLFRPTTFFSNMNPNGSFMDAVIYALIVGCIGGIFFRLSGYIFLFILQMPKKVLFQALDLKGILFSPITTFLVMITGSLVTHLFLLLLCRKRKPLLATFKVASYSISTGISLIFPIFPLNVMICIVWNLSIQFMGLRKVHEISSTTSALAIILTLVVFAIAPIAIPLRELINIF